MEVVGVPSSDLMLREGRSEPNIYHIYLVLTVFDVLYFLACMDCQVGAV